MVLTPAQETELRRRLLVERHRVTPERFDVGDVMPIVVAYLLELEPKGTPCRCDECRRRMQ